MVEQCEGRMPRTVEELLKLPGVGRYTACAVASIAYGEVAGLVQYGAGVVTCHTCQSRLHFRSRDPAHVEHRGDAGGQ